MAFSKVTLNGTTLMDIRDTTAKAADVREGKKFYGADGVAVLGTNTGGGSEPSLQSKTATPTKSQQVITADSQYDGLSDVTVEPIPSQYIVPTGSISVTANGTVDVAQFASAVVNVPTGSTIKNQNKTVTPTKSQQSLKADSGYTGLGTVTVNAIPSQYIEPTGNKEITSNATGIDVAEFATVTVNVPTGSTINNQDKTVTPTESKQTVSADTGYTGLGTVTVNAISSTYVGSGITQRDETDLTASGATVTVPSGYYAEQETKSVSSGSVTSPTSISGTSATVSTGTNTLTLTKTVSVTPRVTTAGYVSSGTAGNSSVSLTASVTTQAAKTVTPTKSSQTAVASGVYTTGAVTVAAIPADYITTTDATASASDILSGETAYVNGSKVTGTLEVKKYYYGTSDPVVGNLENGDIYLKVVS